MNPYPSDDDVAQFAFELFFRERAAPREYAEYRRLAETELLERSFKKIEWHVPQQRQGPKIP